MLNEAIISHVFMHLILLNNSYAKDNYEIIGVDQKIEDNILKFKTSFSADILLKYKKTLVIVELKYRSDNPDQARNAIQCLKIKKILKDH